MPGPRKLRRVIRINGENMIMSIPRHHFIMILLCAFLVSGFIMGFAVGGYVQQKNWEEYNDLLEEKMENDCICYNESTGDKTWKGLNYLS